MLVKRVLLFIFFLLGIWVQSASACTDAHVALAPAQKAFGIAVPAVSEDFVVIGSEQRCECPAMAQNAQSAVSESSKSPVLSYTEGADAFPYPSNPDSVEFAVHARASSFNARRSAQPPYLLVPRLRQ